MLPSTLGKNGSEKAQTETTVEATTTWAELSSGFNVGLIVESGIGVCETDIERGRKG